MAFLLFKDSWKPFVVCLCPISLPQLAWKGFQQSCNLQLLLYLLQKLLRYYKISKYNLWREYFILVERRINCFHISLLQCETLLMFPVSAFYKEIKAQCVAYRIPSYPFCYYHKPIRKNKKIFEENFHLCTYQGFYLAQIWQDLSREKQPGFHFSP